MQPRRNQYLVLMGTANDGLTRLYMITSLQPVILSQRRSCLSYTINAQAGTVVPRTTYTPRHVIKELGWVSDPSIFEETCESQPVVQVPTNQPDQDKTFTAWVDALLETFSRIHGANWTLNEANR